MNNYHLLPEKILADMIDKGSLTFTDLENAKPEVPSSKIEKVKNILKARNGRATEKKDWENAQKDNTFESYRQFLEEHPDSMHKEEAEEQMRIIRNRDFQDEYNHIINGIGVTIHEMEVFVQKYKDWPQVEQVRNKIEDLKIDEMETVWKACSNEKDYESFRLKYPNSKHIKEIESIVYKLSLERKQKDEEAWRYARDSRSIPLLEDYIKNFSIHSDEANRLIIEIKDEEDEKAWQSIKDSGTLKDFQDYLSHYSKHKDEALQKEKALKDEAEREPQIIQEINNVLLDPLKDVRDYLALCKKYPSKREDIKQWMLQDMKNTPERYQRDEMYMLLFKDGVYLEKPLFSTYEIINAGILDIDRVRWINTHPEKEQDDKNDVAVVETCFETEKHNTDVFFFGVPGSGKTSVLAGLFSVTDIGDGSTFKCLSKGCMHKGFPYANNLKEAVSNHVFPARTRIRYIGKGGHSNSTGSGSGQPATGGIGQPATGGIGQPAAGEIGQPATGGIGQPATGGIGQPAAGGIGQPAAGGIGQPAAGGIGQPAAGGIGKTGVDSGQQQKDDMFIQIIDAEIETEKGSTNKVSIVEMPGERTLQFAAADSKNMDMLGEGTKTLFTNDNRKVFFFVIDPDDGKKYQVNMFGTEVKMSQAGALTAVADFLVQMIKDGQLNNLDSVHVIMSKSDIIKAQGKGMAEAIKEIMSNSEYKSLVIALKTICDHRIGNVNAHCNHTPLLYPFSLGKILPGDMFDYDPSDSQTILKVIRANTISIGSSKWYDVLIEMGNKTI